MAFVFNELLCKYGHEVRVWGPSEEFPNLHLLTPLRRLIFHLRDLLPNRHTAEEIIAWKPDVLLTHNLTGCGFGTPRCVKEAGVRWVHVLHDVQLFEPSGQILFGEGYALARNLWRGTWSQFRRAAMGEPDAVVSPTSWLLREHERRGFFSSAAKEVIPNPLDVSLGLDTSFVRDPRQVLYVGRLDSDKGIDILLGAWERVRRTASKLVLVGDGGALAEIRSRRDANIEARGFLPPEKTFQAMLESGVVAVPSLVMENQPTVILEALAFSCRVVASDLGGIRETLDTAGWLVEPGSADSLALGIKAALSEPDDKERARNRDKVLNHHNSEESVLRLIGLFKSNL